MVFLNKHPKAVMLHIIAISGSLRRSSSNTILLRAAARLAPENMTITLYNSIGDLPHFNPDLTGSEPQSVTGFRTQLQSCDGILICTPEYAHGVPGVLKNALDWIVSSGELIDKPVALLNASARSVYAIASLTETITVMMGRIVNAASLTLQLPTNNISEEGILADHKIADALRNGLIKLGKSIEEVHK
jgi:chromate reductase